MDDFNVKQALKSISQKQDTDEWNKFQEAEREKLNAAGELNAVNQNFLFGVRAVELGKNVIKDLKKSDMDYETNLAFERNRIAEGFALQGNYAEAVKWVADADKRKNYQDIYDAIQRNDDETCSCKDKSFTKLQFFYNGAMRSLMCCPKCGFLNAI